MDKLAVRWELIKAVRAALDTYDNTGFGGLKAYCDALQVALDVYEEAIKKLKRG